ncbi:MAG TPA: hypothetical protein VFR67_20990 [Pilimelia sp.]|nr:hypothetical protein [Pilimelia sp.]
MTQVDLAAIADTLPDLDLTLVEAGSGDLHHLPQLWRPIVAQTDPRIRLATGLALWNVPFLDALPQFAAALRTRFADVRACRADGEPALLYLANHPDGHLLSWIGFDPADFVKPQF